MKDSSLGSFLQQLRKENQLTQKELASQLHVTDKAVSKWERDLSAPDISLLIPLAQILGVSTTELLQGRRMADPPQAETESSVAEALRYSDRQVRHRLRRLWAHALLLFSALCLLAAGICLLCDFCLSGRLSWSLIVLLSLALAWVVTVPLFQAKVHRVRACFLALSLALIPYLLGLWTLLPLPLPFTLATAAVSLAGLWAAYGVCRKLRHRPWRAAGAVLLLTIPVSFLIDSLFPALLSPPVQAFPTPEAGFSALTTLLLALACLGIDYARTHHTPPGHKRTSALPGKPGRALAPSWHPHGQQITPCTPWRALLSRCR